MAGSSPRMRGTPRLCRDAASGRGIIPAYAGNTLWGNAKEASKRDHPRVCGEHIVKATRGRVREGSSPRMRGTPFPTSKPCVTMGIIPAYAGNTSMPSETPPAHRDHPRVCGEHRHIESFARELPGSSPRMRGTRARIWRMPWHAGIIPAYAGNTRPRQTTVARQRDHPRVCGEHIRGSSL